MIYEAEVSYMIPEGGFYTVDATDTEDAEFKIIEMVKEDSPEAAMIVVDNVKEATPRRAKEVIR